MRLRRNGLAMPMRGKSVTCRNVQFSIHAVFDRKRVGDPGKFFKLFGKS